MDITLFLRAALQAGTPLLFATLGEVLTEKAGNLNLGVEGLMLLGAVGGFAAGLITQSAIVAIIVALLAGALGGLLYAFLTVTLQTNQVVTGLALTIFGTGISGYAGRFVMGDIIPNSIRTTFKSKAIPLLSDIPFIGEILFNQNIFVYGGIILAILMTLYLTKTKQGKNLRSVGENPSAADASGIPVTSYKYIHIITGSAISALGGAYLSLVHVPAWQENITAGRGWIAVALVIFSMWSPTKAIFGAYLFGGLDIIGFRLQQTNIAISQYIIGMFPYLITILVLVISSIIKRRQQAPNSLGVSYFREDR